MNRKRHPMDDPFLRPANWKPGDPWDQLRMTDADMKQATMNSDFFLQGEEEGDEGQGIYEGGEDERHEKGAMHDTQIPTDSGEVLALEEEHQRSPLESAPAEGAGGVQETLSASMPDGKGELVMHVVPGTPLEKWEAVIRQQEPGFYVMAEAFHEIKSKELYKERGYKSFSAYIHNEWLGIETALTEGRISQLAKAGETLKNFTNGKEMSHPSTGSAPKTQSAYGPTNERQLRALAKVAPEDRLPVWIRAGEIAREEPPPKGIAAKYHKPGKVSTRHILMAIEEMFPTEEPEEIEATGGVEVQRYTPSQEQSEVWEHPRDANEENVCLPTIQFLSADYDKARDEWMLTGYDDKTDRDMVMIVPGRFLRHG